MGKNAGNAVAGGCTGCILGAVVCGLLGAGIGVFLDEQAAARPQKQGLEGLLDLRLRLAAPCLGSCGALSARSSGRSWVLQLRYRNAETGDPPCRRRSRRSAEPAPTPTTRRSERSRRLANPNRNQAPARTPRNHPKRNCCDFASGLRNWKLNRQRKRFKGRTKRRRLSRRTGHCRRGRHNGFPRD